MERRARFSVWFKSMDMSISNNTSLAKFNGQKNILILFQNWRLSTLKMGRAWQKCGSTWPKTMIWSLIKLVIRRCKKLLWSCNWLFAIRRLPQTIWMLPCRLVWWLLCPRSTFNSNKPCYKLSQSQLQISYNTMMPKIPHHGYSNKLTLKRTIWISSRATRHRSDFLPMTPIWTRNRGMLEYN